MDEMTVERFLREYDPYRAANFEADLRAVVAGERERAVAEEREAILALRVSIAQTEVAGCQTHGCAVRKPTGVATNGGCRCSAQHGINAYRAAIRARGGE
ncbi:MAG: hypothetical protein AB7I13_10465 [Vicinamibacterales bacterium]